MAEESDIPSEDPRDQPADAAAMHFALNAGSRESANAYLDEQTSLIRLQKEHLHEQRLLLLSHLKWRRFDDQLKGALQIMLVALGAVVVVAIGTAMWNASQADGLVIDSFSVPPSLAQAGLSGEVVADDMTGKLAAVRRFASDHSFSTSKDVSKTEKDQVRVEIPDAGISLSEALRYLRAWLGNERHANGNVRQMADGQIGLTVSVSGLAPVTVTGKADDLDRLETEAAEKVFAEIDPVNIVNYLSGKHRLGEAFAAAARYVPLADTQVLRADSYGLWSYTTAGATGDFDLAIARAHTGLAIDPDLAVLHVQLVKFYSSLGWDEAALRESEAILPLRVSDQPVAHRAHGFAEMQVYARNTIARLRGDYADKSAGSCDRFCTYPSELLQQSQASAQQHDPPGAFALIAAASAAGSMDQADRAEAHFLAEAAAGDWKTAKADAVDGAAEYARENSDINPRFVATVLSVRYRPLEALAEAHLGEYGLAHRTVDATPVDCYSCVRVRGAIDGLEQKQAAAAAWYARAIHDAPSIPFAYADWGAMLLRAGDTDGAIAKFKLANEKGPHFADPLEMWGEALMQQNRSDLALAKFQEAAQYAPNWGRLHLEWGKALAFDGKMAESKKQMAVAATLDLSAAEKASLAAWTKTHG